MNWSRVVHPPVIRHMRRVIKEGLIDAAIVYAAYGAAFFLRTVLSPLELIPGFTFISYAAITTFTCLYACGVYRRIWSRTSGHDIRIIFYASMLSLLILSAINQFTRPQPLPFSVLIVGHALAFAGFAGVRYRSRLISGLSWRWDAIWNQKFPQQETRVLIIGAGESGQSLAWRLKYRSTRHHYHVAGFVDDDSDKQGMFIEGSPVLGTRRDIERLVMAYRIDLVAVAIHNISGQEFRDILNHCEKTEARIKVVPNLFALMDTTVGSNLLRDVQAEDLMGRSPITRHERVDLTPVTGKSVLITGAAGSIGSELSRQIATYAPTTVVLVDNNESGLHDVYLELSARWPNACYVPILADVTDREPLRTVFRVYRPQLVFHAAAYKHVPMLEQFPGAGIHTNIEGTRRMVELARDHHAERFVLISTDKAVNPSSIMGATKRACELVLHAYSREGSSTLFTAVRFGNVLGSRGSVVPTFERQIESGGPVKVTHPEMTRYFMSIPEAVNLVIHAACLTEGDDIFLLRMGEVVRIVELAERMIRVRGLRPYKDIAIEFSGIRPGEKLHEQLFGDHEQPSDTVHPHIVLVNTWDDQFDARAFLTHLPGLEDVGYMDGRTALRELSTLIGDKEQMAVGAD